MARATRATATFNVTVVDTTPPQLTVPANILEEATSPAGATVHFTPSATDAVDANVAIACLPASGTHVRPRHHHRVLHRDGRRRQQQRRIVHRHRARHDRTDAAPARRHHGRSDLRRRRGRDVRGQRGRHRRHERCGRLRSAVGQHVRPGLDHRVLQRDRRCRQHIDGIVQGSRASTRRAPTIAAHADVDATAQSQSSAVVTYDNPSATDLVDGTLPPRATAFGFDVRGRRDDRDLHRDRCRRQQPHEHVQGQRALRLQRLLPPDRQPADVNAVNAGQAIPVKFSLGGNQGLSIFTAGSPKVAIMSCQANTAQDAIEETVTAGNSTLSYDAGRPVQLRLEDGQGVGGFVPPVAAQVRRRQHAGRELHLQE